MRQNEVVVVLTAAQARAIRNILVVVLNDEDLSRLTIGLGPSWLAAQRGRDAIDTALCPPQEVSRD